MIYHYINVKRMEGMNLKLDRKSLVGDWLDGAATCASAACLVHCLVLPLAVALLPALAEHFDPGEGFHTLILLFAIPTSALALIPGWRRGGAVGPLATGAAGLALMGLGLAVPHQTFLETAVTVSGSLLVAAAHFANWKKRRAHCGPDDVHEQQADCPCRS